MNLYIYVIIAIFVWNVLVFALYGADKMKAKKGAHRISEKSLLLAAFILGSIGAAMGMMVFRHKTKHMKFKILVPLYLIVHIAAAAVIFFYFI